MKLIQRLQIKMDFFLPITLAQMPLWQCTLWARADPPSRTTWKLYTCSCSWNACWDLHAHGCARTLHCPLIPHFLTRSWGQAAAWVPATQLDHLDWFPGWAWPTPPLQTLGKWTSRWQFYSIFIWHEHIVNQKLLALAISCGSNVGRWEKVKTSTFEL